MMIIYKKNNKNNKLRRHEIQLKSETLNVLHIE